MKAVVPITRQDERTPVSLKAKPQAMRSGGASETEGALRPRDLRNQREGEEHD